MLIADVSASTEMLTETVLSDIALRVASIISTLIVTLFNSVCLTQQWCSTLRLSSSCCCC